MKPGRILLTLCIAACSALVAQTQQPSPQPVPPPAPSQTAQLPPPMPVSVVVIDPAHGGADPGARGAAGILEKDVVLHFALLLRDQLQRQGLRVVLTRQASEGLGFDDRAAVANSYRSAVYISLHVASTGPAETARCYFDSTAAPPAASPNEQAPGPAPRWDRAQQPYTEASRRLASLLQAQLKEKFPASPLEPAAVPIRPLSNVAAPAVAVEVSSVSVSNREQLDRMAGPLAEAVVRAVAAFRGGGG